METILLVVVLALVFAIVCLWILWQWRVIMPIKFFCTRVGSLARYREGEWAGQGTGRYTKKTRFGHLWWGYNQKTHNEFVIFNGRVGIKSFQVQNWRPRFAIWGGPILPWRLRPVKPWVAVDPNEENKFVWPNGTQAQLRVYLANHPQRKPAEAHFAHCVRRDIEQVRHGEFVNLWLLIESLKELRDRRYTHHFGTWLWAVTGILGEDTCRSIGKTVCEQEHFTVDEGEKIQEEYRKKEAKTWGLPDTASWQEIQSARSQAEKMHLAWSRHAT